MKTMAWQYQNGDNVVVMEWYRARVVDSDVVSVLVSPYGLIDEGFGEFTLPARGFLRVFDMKDIREVSDRPSDRRSA